MKSLVQFVVLLFGVVSLLPVYAAQEDVKSAEAALNNADAVQAVAIANEWKWSRKNIKSYVTTREVVFKFSDKRERKIPLPDDKMLIAVAPYIKRTHR